MKRERATIDDPDDADAAEAAALRILAGAAQAASALERRLRQRGFSLSAVRSAVARCRELGYIDDSALATSVVTRQQRAGHGRSRAVLDLRRRGVSSAAAADALAGFDEEQEQEAANRAAQDLYDRELKRGRIDQRVSQRVGAALQRRGFAAGVIVRALRSVRT